MMLSLVFPDHKCHWISPVRHSVAQIAFTTQKCCPCGSSSSFTAASLSIRGGASLYTTQQPLIFIPRIKPTWPLQNQHPPPHNPTTMTKMILMHREAGGLVQPISTHRRRGSAVIYMLMVLVETRRTGPGQGATLCCWWRRFLREQRSTAPTTPQCGKPSAGPHLVQPAGPFTHCLIRRVCWTLLLLFSGAQTLPGLFSNTN